MLEMILAQHCAPALAGIKPSNIAMCKKAECPNLHADVDKLNSQLNGSDIYIEILCECEVRALIMVYRGNVLKKHLTEAKNNAFLAGYGYSEADTIAEFLNILRNRLSCDSFPHEIGVFLGYPLRDIYSFIKHRNTGCILTGDWRVYHDAEGAKKTFRRFKACKDAVSRKVSDGRTLAQIFCAA